MTTITIGIMFLLFTCMYIWLWIISRRWFACAPAAYGVASNCRHFEKHSSTGSKKRLSVLTSRLLSMNVKVKIYKTIILPVVLYGCETWSLTSREEGEGV
jgi:hypothetical protein